MPVRRLIRETLFQIARHDIAMFLEEHEEALIAVFREEVHKLDEAIPDEETFIDIKMVPLSETIIRASLRAVRRFLTEDIVKNAPPHDDD